MVDVGDSHVITTLESYFEVEFSLRMASVPYHSKEAYKDVLIFTKACVLSKLEGWRFILSVH